MLFNNKHFVAPRKMGFRVFVKLFKNRPENANKNEWCAHVRFRRETCQESYGVRDQSVYTRDTKKVECIMMCGAGTQCTLLSEYKSTNTDEGCARGLSEGKPQVCCAVHCFLVRAKSMHYRINFIALLVQTYKYWRRRLRRVSLLVLCFDSVCVWFGVYMRACWCLIWGFSEAGRIY